MKKFLCLLLAACLFLLLFGCAKTDNQPPSIPVIENPTITLTTCYAGAAMDICSPELRSYLDAKTEAEQIDALLDFSGFDLAYQAAAFDWEGDDSTSYTVYFADNVAFENAVTVKTSATSLSDYGTFIPGTTYYWKVEGNAQDSTSVIDYFTVPDAPARFIGTESIINVRDIGGWKTEDGHSIRYGMIYRCGKTNPGGKNTCSEEDVALFTQTLGVVTEIDLRGSDAYGQTMSVFGEDITYLRAPMSSYSCILPQFSQLEPVAAAYNAQSPDSIRLIFEMLGKEDSYPLVFHCNAGADRTGTLAFLINGVLGVPFADLTRDFELTSFAGGHIRWRSDITQDASFADYGIMLEDDSNYIAWNQMYSLMMEHYGTEDGTLQSAIENYLINTCKVNKEDIDVLRKMMLK